MRDTQTAYPVKVNSRRVSARNTKIRLSWFVVGTSFGIGCATALTPLFQQTPQNMAQNVPATVAPAAVIAAAATPPAPVAAAPAVAAANPAPPAQTDTVAAPAAAAPVVLTGADAQTAEKAKDNAPMSLDAIVSKTSADQWQDAEVQPEPIAEKAEADAAKQYPVALDLKVNKGDSLTSLLTDAGAPYDEAHSIVESVRKNFDPKKLDVGQTISVNLDKPDNSEQPVIASLSLPVSVTSSLEVTRSKNGAFNVKKVETPVERRLTRAGGRIKSSLYETGMESGLPASLLGEIINAYSYDVDFQRDIQQGDSMDVLFERNQTEEGVVTGYGNIVFAELNLGDRVLKIYRYQDKYGAADYYNEKGESIRKALLRTPVNGARITSGFGLRTHPLLGYTKMHRGIDFGAPTGTPIYAAGDGTVEFVGRKGGYGNYLRIRHNNKYESAYAHISRFASGVAPGRKVRQGQIIAYVGSTGNSTGPHLHYEILVSGEQVNPGNVKFKNGNILQGKELLAFRQNMQQIEAKLASLPQGKQQVAMLEQPKNKNKN